jgi:hypothetical protein
VPEITEYHIKRKESTAIAEVNIAVNGRTANIHSYMPLIEGFKDFFGTGKGIVDFKGLAFVQLHCC